MKHGFAFWFVLCLLFLSVVGHAEEVAERPVYSQGDYWIFIDGNGKTAEWKFLREEKDTYVFSREGSEVVKDFSLMDVSKAGGFPGPIVKFPLKKGSWWKYQYTDASLTTGERERVVRYEAVSYEKVAVAAGTFPAFMITATIEGLSRDKKGIRALGSATYWYAPEVKQVIRWEKGNQRWELKEYKVR